MAIAVSQRLGADLEQKMRDFFATLSEKDRRRFAALEARQLGYGGIDYIADVVGCSRRTIAPDCFASSRVRSRELLSYT